MATLAFVYFWAYFGGCIECTHLQYRLQRFIPTPPITGSPGPKESAPRQFADFSPSSTPKALVPFNLEQSLALSNMIQWRIETMFESQRILHQQRKVIQQLIMLSNPIEQSSDFMDSTKLNRNSSSFATTVQWDRSLLFGRLRTLWKERANLQKEINRLLRQQEAVDRHIDDHLLRTTGASHKRGISTLRSHGPFVLPKPVRPVLIDDDDGSSDGDEGKSASTMSLRVSESD